MAKRGGHNHKQILQSGCDVGNALSKIYDGLMLLACVSMLAAFATIMLGVVAREAGWDIQGLDAYAGYSIAAALSGATRHAAKWRSHPRVSLILQRSPARIQNILEYWALLVGLTLALFMAVRGAAGLRVMVNP